ncbi:MAG: aldehyde dehydrogenase [Hyphomicrobiaceae bacterium]
MALRKFQQYIDGKFEDGSETFESLDPATEKPWAVMPAASENDVNRAVAAAKRMLTAPEWTGLTPTARGKLLYKLADLVAEQAQDIAKLETADTGKIIRETTAQVGYAAEYFRYYAGLADKIEGAHLPIDKPDMETYLRREPIGVVAAVVPWNSQIFLAGVKLGPALAAGCPVVLKASEEGPAPLLHLAKLFHEAGFPPGVVNVITGFGEPCGRALTSHPDVARVAFTGGPETARHVVANTANNLASTTLELGGKSPVLAFDDIDVSSVANTVVAGIFGATGQSCVAGSRLIVQKGVRDELVAILAKKAEAINIGPPDDMATEVGPLCTKAQRDKIEKVVADSLANGGELVTGGKRPDGFDTGYYYSPTIISCGHNAVPSAATELFGPVLSVLTFDDEDEAIAIANDTPYGLASGVFTKDLTRAHRMIRRIHAGIVWVNTYRAVSPVAPFGGYGMSGYGRESGAESVLDYTRVKSVWIRTSDDPIPDPFVMR